MYTPRVFVTGIGILTPLGRGIEKTREALTRNNTALRPLSLFPVSMTPPLPAGEITAALTETDPAVPRTHRLALTAAHDAMAQAVGPPDAIVLGTTTGGMSITELLIKEQSADPALYRYHGTNTVANHLADVLGCTGTVMTVTTACSSGAIALILAMELIRTGRARRVLAGGADALCRLTYYGFNALQLIDPAGSRPLDATRRGMSVSEAAALLLLEAGDEAPPRALAELVGGGVSCDAHHPAAPHPEGRGALVAMERALADAGIDRGAIGYVNLHGTGTIDNDLAEAKAIRALFGAAIPPLSSIKGATGHSLAAAGALEAVVSVMAVTTGPLPANCGFAQPDPDIGIVPLTSPEPAPVHVVLSNSFGFGGNNAALLIGAASDARARRKRTATGAVLYVRGCAAMTGAGDIDQTLAALASSPSCAGIRSMSDLAATLPPREVRRLKRLPRLVLNLAQAAAKADPGADPGAIFLGTGWGPLSETADFLKKLYESNEQFTSPTDFVGSVHNAPAGQAAIMLGATGPNVTVTGGDYSFEQALLAATLINQDSGRLLVMAADEYHPELTPRFDASSPDGTTPADGGAALLLDRAPSPGAVGIVSVYTGMASGGDAVIDDLLQALGGPAAIAASTGLIMAGIPGACRPAAERQLAALQSALESAIPLLDYRRVTGEFPAASGVAAALAVSALLAGHLPSALGHTSIDLRGRDILLLGLGDCITAVRIIHPA